MRLTLRTLLAYLDDTLEPAQAKMIGQKVAESDTAQELIARIKEVTRRRRLTTPPLSGPSKIDANTIAEYLDNSVSNEQLAEIEQVCLASDVHLAEVAACHQILTLVLGEPALVPPTAKQRMYGLVKGPEAIPFRKPPARSEHEHEYIDESKETDETLRLGLPPYRRKGSWSPRLLVIGGGLLVASLLVLAIVQVLKPLWGEKEGGPVVAQNENQEKNPEPAQPKPAPTENKSPAPKPEKILPKKVKEPEIKKEPDKEKEPEKKKEPDTKPKKPVPKGPEFSDEPVKEPSHRQVEIGSYQPPTTNEKSILLQAQADRSEWKRLSPKAPEVRTGRALVSLPGCRSVVETKSGVKLTLWGFLPELWPMPPLYESLVELHASDQPGLDLDMTLHRGRILLMNVRDDRPVRVRLRYKNPSAPEARETFEISLQAKGSELLVDRSSGFLPTEPFYKDPKNTNRRGPMAQMGLLAMGGEMYLKNNDVTFRLEGLPNPGPNTAAWNNLKGLIDPEHLDQIPGFVSTNPPLPKGMDERSRQEILKARDSMLKARDDLSAELSGDKGLDVALKEALQSLNTFKRRYAVRCLGAIDDLASLIDVLDQESDQPQRQEFIAAAQMRQEAIIILQRWIASSRNAEYTLYHQLKKKYLNSKAQTIVMNLLHNTFYAPDIKDRPETLESLVQYLDNDLLIIRELAYYHLRQLRPDGQVIPYAPVADPTSRRKAQEQWRKLIKTPLKLPKATQ